MSDLFGDFEVWEGDLFLGYCYEDDAAILAEAGYRVVRPVWLCE